MKSDIAKKLAKSIKWPSAEQHVIVSISSGSGFFEIIFLQELTGNSINYGYVIEDTHVFQDDRLKSNFSYICLPFEFKEGVDGCLRSLSTHENIHYFFIGINMNFYNDWDFFNEFMAWKKDVQVSYFFLWNPHFENQDSIMSFSPNVHLTFPSIHIKDFCFLNTGMIMKTG